ncbi:MAG TPA: surface-adhesin E family protein [Ramlibacter sp.]|nr:surface-adhesin E family protein [Ramlibacter sp.]
MRTRKTFPLLAALVSLSALAQAPGPNWVSLGSVHDRVYLMNRPSLSPIEGGFAFGVFTDKDEPAPADPLPNGKKYRSSFLNVEVNCGQKSFRIARARFFSDSRASGSVVAEDQARAGEGWAAAQPDSLGETFVKAGCAGS